MIYWLVFFESWGAVNLVVIALVLNCSYNYRLPVLQSFRQWTVDGDL